MISTIPTRPPVRISFFFPSISREVLTGLPSPTRNHPAGKTSCANSGKPFGCQIFQQKNFSKNRLGHKLPCPFGLSRNRQNLTLSLLKLGLALIAFITIWVSLYWSAYISNVSQVNIYRGYRRVQLKLVVDLFLVEELANGRAEYENYVLCYCTVSVSSNSAEANGHIEYERKRALGFGKGQNCLILPPEESQDSIEMSDRKGRHMEGECEGYKEGVLVRKFYKEDDGVGRASLFSL